jgi:hypothetical protein
LCAAVGVPFYWLPACALLGLSIGPALTTASLAALNVIGVPQTRRLFFARARSLGVPDTELDEIWRRAVGVVDTLERARLGGRGAKEAT